MQTAQHLLSLGHLIRAGYRRDIRNASRASTGTQHINFVLDIRITQADADEEPVELRFGQPVGSVEVYGVLGGNDDERIGDRSGQSLVGYGEWCLHLTQSLT